jgi:two-component system, OmpR family, sensor histidine kinase KdpD
MPDMDYRRPNPEQLLEQAEAEERSHRRGKLKIFLGYASGVGKSYRMLDEGRRRKMRGQDVVVVATQSTASPEVEDLLAGFEVIQPFDLDTVLARHPQVCLIDGLAYRNPPGSKHSQRWQDVEELLSSGISVITSINLQYVKERQAQVEAIRGKRAKDSAPEEFIRSADEIELVDAPPEYCLIRSGDGMDEGKLSSLREIALLLAADVVDRQLEQYLRRHGIEQMYGTHERILVCVTPRSNADLMIRRGKRQAERFHGEMFVVYVQQDELSAADQQILDMNLRLAREASAHVEVLHGEDAIASILRYALSQGITQLFVGHSGQSGWLGRWRLSAVERLILEADSMDVRIFPQQELPNEA